MAFTAAIEGTDITPYCQRIVHRPEHNLPSFAEVLVPSSLVSLTEGLDRLILTDGGVQHAGRAVYGEDNGNADNAFRTIQSRDSRCFFDRWQVMDADGDYSDPDIIEDNENACDIFAAAIENWNSFEGQSEVGINSSAGGTPLIGMRPVNWPMTIEQLRTMLVDTGQLDIVMDQATGQLDLHAGDYGPDLTSIVLQYATGAFNCTAAKYTYDFAKTVSRIRYFLGPKRPQFEGDIQHWAGDVQIDDPGLDIFDGGKQATIDGLSSAVESILMRLRRIEVYDSNGDENALRDLYYAIWQSDAFVNMRPRRLLTLTPQPGLNPALQVGGLITTAAVLGESHSAVQRVYSYEKVQDAEGNVSVTSVTTSADQ